MPTTPEEYLRRLRAIYCRHRAITYEEYDRLVAEEKITFQEAKELVELLFGEIQNVGLYDFLYQEEVREKHELKKRLTEIQEALARIGSMTRSMPALKDGYMEQIRELTEEGNAIKRRLAS